MALQLKKAPKVDPESTKTKKAPAAKPFVATLPSVNLLAPEVLEVISLRKLRRTFIVAAVLVLALIGVAWGSMAGMIAVANKDLAAEQARTSQLSQEMAALAPVKVFYGAIDQNETTIRATMTKEVLYSKVVAELDQATPAGLGIGNVSLTADTTAAPVAGAVTTGAGTCPSPDPFATLPQVGCVTVDGTAADRSVLGDWIANIEENDTFTEVFVSSTSADDTGKVTFAATVGLSDQVYSGRYTDPEFFGGEAQ